MAQFKTWAEKNTLAIALLAVVLGIVALGAVVIFNVRLTNQLTDRFNANQEAVCQSSKNNRTRTFAFMDKLEEIDIRLNGGKESATTVELATFVRSSYRTLPTC